MRFRTLLLGHHDDHSISRIGEALDAMEHKVRVDTIRSATKEDMVTLWELVKDQSLDAEHFVPSGTDPLKEVIHYGKNSLPAFTHFQKRFCRPKDAKAEDELFGYNHNGPGLTAVTGPGYYVAHKTDSEKNPDGAYVVDYTRLPDTKPDAWPDIRKNEAGLSRLVYAGMKDYMRKVSSHVSIGRAHKYGKVTNNWFLLCREDPAS